MIRVEPTIHELCLEFHSLRCNAKNFFISPRSWISPRHKPSRRASAAPRRANRQNCLIGPPTKDATNQPTLPTKTRRSCPIALRIAPSTPSSPLTLSTNPQRRTARSTYPLCRAEDAHDTFVRSTRARRSRHVRFAPKADKEQTRRYVRFAPLASLTRCSKLAPVSAAILVFGQPLAPPGRRMVVQCGTPPVFSAFVCNESTAVHGSFNLASAKYPYGRLTLEGGVP
jgi:hypothetical protein